MFFYKNIHLEKNQNWKSSQQQQQQQLRQFHGLGFAAYNNNLLHFNFSRVPHGREEVFRGNFYDNVFVHFYPDWYVGATSEEVMFPSTHDKGRTRFDEQWTAFPAMFLCIKR